MLKGTLTYLKYLSRSITICFVINWKHNLSFYNYKYGYYITAPKFYHDNLLSIRKFLLYWSDRLTICHLNLDLKNLWPVEIICYGRTAINSWLRLYTIHVQNNNCNHLHFFHEVNMINFESFGKQEIQFQASLINLIRLTAQKLVTRS